MVYPQRLTTKPEKPTSGAEVAIETETETTESFQEYCKEIFLKSQVSGFKQIASARNVVQRTLKTIVFVGCLTGFLYQTITFMSLYGEMPTFTEVEMRMEDYLTFPAVTVCQGSRLMRTAVCRHNTTFCEENLECDRLLKDHVIEEYMSQHDVKHLVKMSPQFKKFVRCRSDGKYLEGICNHVSRVFSADLPSCFTFNSRWLPEHLGKPEYRFQEGDELVLDLNFEFEQSVEWERNIGGRFVLGGVHDMVRAGQEGFILRPGHKYTVTFKSSSTVRLPPPHWTNCVKYSDTWDDNPDQGVPRVFTKKMCIWKCVEVSMDTTCGCLPTHHPIPVVENTESVYLLKHYCATTNSSETFCLNQNLPEITRHCQTTCRRECESFSYDVEVDERSYPPLKLHSWDPTIWTYWEKNNVSLRVVFKTGDHVTYSYKPKFQTVELLSVIGGYIGVWLGISLVAFFDFLENVALLLRYFCKKNRYGRKVIEAIENRFFPGQNTSQNNS